MKRIIVLLALVSSLSSEACDVCGCRSSNYSWGLGYRFNSSVSLGYQQAVFHSTHPGLFDPSAYTTTEEMFRSISLRGNYAVNDRLMIGLNVPIVFNNYFSEDELSSINSLGDMSVNAMYRIIQPKEEESFTLDVSAGFKLPSGTYSSELNSLPPAVLPGTGAWDVFAGVRAAYSLSESWMLDGRVNSIIPTRNPEGYRFGSQLQSQLLSMNRLWASPSEMNSLHFLAGYLFSYDGIDTDETALPTSEIADTDGSFHSITAGLLFQSTVWQFEGRVNAPFYQDFANGLVDAEPTLQFNITYFFESKK